MSSIRDRGSICELSEVGTVSFWDLKQFHRTVRRVEHANQLCSDLASMIRSRARIEKQYAQSLIQWCDQWKSSIDKSSEYGTAKSAWFAFCEEAEQTADVHLKVREKLTNGSEQVVKDWQRNNFHTSNFPTHHVKEAKHFEKDFTTAQKPWSRFYKSVQRTKRDYHKACKAKRSCQHQALNARSDVSTTTEQHVKLENRVKKAEGDEIEALKIYRNALVDLNGDIRRYMSDMTAVFERAQDFEKKRIDFFAETFNNLCHITDTSRLPELPQIHTNFIEVVDSMSSDADLEDWSYKHGADMTLHVPQFEDYKPELRGISKHQERSNTFKELSSGITLTRISSTVNENSTYPIRVNGSQYSGSHYDALSNASYRAEVLPDTYTENVVAYRRSSNDYTKRPPILHSDSDKDTTSYNVNRDTNYQEGYGPSSSTPVTVREGDERSQPLGLELNVNGGAIGGDQIEDNVSSRISVSSDVESQPQTPPRRDSPTMEEHLAAVRRDDGSPGVPVVALYDYKGLEEDELTFEAGTEFSKLSDVDEQGWCKGRLNGIVGLYPANYVRDICNEASGDLPIEL